MNDTSEKQTKVAVRSDDFRYIPCDAINLAMSDNGVKLILGVEEVDQTTLELVGIHMTHRTAMLLKTALDQSLTHYQKQTGVTIEVPTLAPEQL